MKTIRQMTVKRDVTEALHSRNGPNIEEVLGLAIGEDVLV